MFRVLKLDSNALTKVQSMLLVAIIVIAAIGGTITYILMGSQDQSIETIKIGVCSDIDNFSGEAVWQGAVLAAEQVNAEGGVLGRLFEVVAEDDDNEAGNDLSFATNAMNKLIHVDNVDFILSHSTFSSLVYQDIAAQQETILFSNSGPFAENATQRVLDDYANYKYFFRSGVSNTSMSMMGTIQSLMDCREYTGFNKVALVYHDLPGDWISTLVDFLDDYDFELVYNADIPMDTLDFSSYFSHAENAGAEILYPIILGQAGIPFVTEYYNRESPMVMWGLIAMGQQNDFWDLTEGNCEHTSNTGYPIVAGYPLTSKTLATRDAFIERWGEEIKSYAASAYDTVRFILPDAINRAGTTDSEAVIEALETMDIETSLARHYRFTTSHDILILSGDVKYPREDYFLVCMFQWQDGVQMPVFPRGIMEEAGTTYTYPDWAGPWDD